MTYQALKQYAEALRASNRFVTEMATLGDRHKQADADYMQMMALGWNKRYGEAINAAMAIDARYADEHDANFRVHRLHALTCAVGYYAWGGDPASGLALLDVIEQSHPGSAWVTAPFRRVAEALLGTEQLAE